MVSDLQFTKETLAQLFSWEFCAQSGQTHSNNASAVRGAFRTLSTMPLTIFVKRFTLDVWQGPEYVFVCWISSFFFNKTKAFYYIYPIRRSSLVELFSMTTHCSFEPVSYGTAFLKKLKNSKKRPYSGIFF